MTGRDAARLSFPQEVHGRVEYKDYYKVMGVERDASQEEIKRAYRKLARKYHPDVSKEPDAETRFQEVQEAYAVLKDPEKRTAYDQLGSGWREGQDFRPPPGWGADRGFQYSGNVSEEDARAFSDFFEELFGGGRARGHRTGAGGFGGFGADFGGAGGRGFGEGAFHGRGQDHVARVEVPLEIAHTGGQQRITLPAQDGGESRSLNVRIPAGVTDGQHIRLSGQGGAGVGRGGKGDLYLEIRLKPHPVFRVEGRDVHVDLPIAPWEAALGESVKVPTLGGEVETRIRAGAKSGQRMRLKGRGLSGSPAGDQYLHLKIVAPEPRDDRQRKLYEEMRDAFDFDPRAELRRRTA